MSPSRLIRAFLNYSIKSGISNNVWCKKHIRGLPLVAFGTTNAIKFALSLVDVVGYQSPVSPWAHLQHEGSEQLRLPLRVVDDGRWHFFSPQAPQLQAGHQQRCLPWFANAAFHHVDKCPAKSWSTECMSAWIHLIRIWHLLLTFGTSRNFPFNSKIRPKVPDPILKIPHWSHANSVRDHQKLYAQLYGSPEPRPIDQQNSEICRAEAATREPALIGLLFVECSLPKNLTGKFWFKTHQIPSIS